MAEVKSKSESRKAIIDELSMTTLSLAESRSSKTGSGEILLVVALDFGTTYSGYAFSFRNNPHDIFANQQWDSGKYRLSSYKTPTCVLINKANKNVYKFGYDAENEYSDIPDDETDNYYFFDKFKMLLHSMRSISEDFKLTDMRGTGSLLATEVFSVAIRALKDHVMGHLQRRGNIIKSDEIQWVLTVPAIWTDKAKTFMRKCAEKADIKHDRLSIALEPEAASIYCQYQYRKADDSGHITGPTIIKQGTSYLVVDIGGGTVDITAHQKEIHDKVRELCFPTGAAYGGTTVDKEFLQVLEDVVGTTVIDKLKKDYTSNYFDLIRGFEVLKRNILKKRQAINFQFPVVAFEQLCQSCLQKSFVQALRDSKHNEKISLATDKLRIDKDFIISLFKQTADKIVEEIQMTLRQTEQEVKIFLLVGGFSESDIIDKKIRDAFPDKQIVIPDDPTLAVVRGAVLFGHRPNFISSRYTRYAYGRRIRPIFNETIHDMRRSVAVDGALRCKDVFELFMEKNKYCDVGTIKRVQYHTMEKKQQKITIAIYVSDNNNTKYIDEDGCEQLGELVVDIPNPTNERRYVDVDFQFGGTELIVKAQVQGTHEHCIATFKLI